MELDIFGDWITHTESELPAPQPAQDLPVNGHTSSLLPPVNLPRKQRSLTVVNWNPDTFTLIIAAGSANLSHKLLNQTVKEWKEAHPRVDFVKVKLSHGCPFMSQQIYFLERLGFVPVGLSALFTYIRDLRQPRVPKPEAKPQVLEPEKPELNWTERELQICQEALAERKKLGVHKTFLTTLEAQAADLQKQVDESQAVKESPEYLELCRQEEEIARQLQELNRDIS